LIAHTVNSRTAPKIESVSDVIRDLQSKKFRVNPVDIKERTMVSVHLVHMEQVHAQHVIN